MLEGAVDHGRADGRETEIGFLLLYEIPGRPLGEVLTGAVGGGAVGDFGLVVRDRVPVCFAVGVAWAVAEGGGEAGGDDDALDLWSVGVYCLDDFGGTLDGGLQEVALIILDFHGEGGGGVDDSIYILDGFVEGARTGDVGNDGEG